MDLSTIASSVSRIDANVRRIDEKMSRQDDRLDKLERFADRAEGALTLVKFVSSLLGVGGIAALIAWFSRGGQ